MSTGNLQRIIAQYRQRLLQHEQQAEDALDSAYASVLRELAPALNRLYDQIAQKMETLDQDETIPSSWIYERLRLEQITLLIQRQVDNFAALALQQVRMQQHTGANLGQMSASEQLDALVPNGVSWTFGIPSTKALEGLVGATQAGSPLADLFHGFGSEAVSKVTQALLTGVATGTNPRQIAPGVQDALGISRSRALTIARTEMLRAYRGANLATYRANDDVVDGWVWSAALSSRTCAACIAMNGTKHPLSEEFGSHPNCRCSPIPLTKSWDSILGKLGIDTSDLPDTRVKLQSGPDWFAEQDEATKKAILGAAKYAAYNNGDFQLEDIVGTSHSDDWGSSIYEKPLKDLVK